MRCLWTEGHAGRNAEDVTPVNLVQDEKVSNGYGASVMCAGTRHERGEPHSHQVVLELGHLGDWFQCSQFVEPQGDELEHEEGAQGNKSLTRWFVACNPGPQRVDFCLLVKLVPSYNHRSPVISR